jgi:hypothetical protein
LGFFIIFTQIICVMKTKLILFSFLLFLFSCATKSVIADISKTPAPQEIKVVKEAVQVENPVIVTNTTSSMNMVLLSKPLYDSKILYENTCNKCHKLYSPNEFSKEEWPRILRSMQRNTKLDDSQISGIQDYIYSQI